MQLARLPPNAADDTSSFAEFFVALRVHSGRGRESRAGNCRRATVNQPLGRLRTLFDSGPKADDPNRRYPKALDQKNPVHRPGRENSRLAERFAKARKSRA